VGFTDADAPVGAVAVVLTSTLVVAWTREHTPLVTLAA
jgi:hypothetical protein